MSKTLYTERNLPAREQSIVDKFRAAATFCGALETSLIVQRNKLYLYAEFGKPDKFRPRFSMTLGEIEWEAMRILESQVTYGIPGPTHVAPEYLDPSVVAADIGLQLSSGDGWRVHHPADLESFLRHFAWLSRLYGKMPLFEKLLEHY